MKPNGEVLRTVGMGADYPNGSEYLTIGLACLPILCSRVHLLRNFPVQRAKSSCSYLGMSIMTMVN